MAAVVKIIKENPGGCQGAMEKALAYIDAHKEAITAGWEYIKRLDESGKEDSVEPLEALVFEYMPDAEKIMDAYEQRCHEHAKKIGKALGI